MEHDDDVEEQTEGYSWEKSYERTWEALTETEIGLQSSAIERKKRKRNLQQATRNIRRGLTRHLYLIIDCSSAMEDTKATAHTKMGSVVKVAENFILDYFDQNPLSQMGIIVSRNEVAEKITELSALKSNSGDTGGVISLQNALEVAKSSLCYVPKYGTREVLIAFGSLTTCDPGNIFDTLDEVKKNNIKVSFISLSAEVHICKTIAEATGGTFNVAMSEEHFKELILNFSPPPPATTKVETSLVKMGFPQQRENYQSLCVCHQLVKYGGYFCPQCQSKVCELPTDCQICGLTLISSPHLARSYHHLFPVPVFTEVPSDGTVRSCFGCVMAIPGPSFVCPRCKHAFCGDCDDYLHDSLHNCPGCEMLSSSNVVQ